MAGLALVIALAGIQMTLAQDFQRGPPNLPAECRGPPPGVERPQECCKIPPFFADEDFAGCGFKKLDPAADRATQERRNGPPDCSKQICMMKKYQLTNEDDSINADKLSAFMDSYVVNNPEFKEPVNKAKATCVGRTLPGPPQICEANKLVFCISSTLFSECPVWEETDGCKSLKSHMDLCKPFFHRQ